MTLSEHLETTKKIKDLTKRIEEEELSLMERCELQDEIEELRALIEGNKEHNRQNPEDCEACGA